MPTGAFGDLVVEMGVDDRKWIEGVLRIQGSTKALATNIEQTAGKASGAFGRGIGQMAFAVQDFSSVLAGGGKMAMERALMSTMNNVQMLGAGFGPWGMAITAAAGALGAILLPKLMEGKGAFDQLAESAETTIKAFEKFGSRMASLNTFRAEVSDVNSAEGVEKLEKRVRLERENAEIKTHAAANAVADIERQIEVAEEARKSVLPRLNDPVMEAVGWAVNPAKSFTAFQIDQQIAEMKKQLEDARGKFRGHAESVREADLKGIELARGEGDVADRERHERNEKRLEQDEKAAERIREQSRTPLQKTREKLDEINRLAREGHLTDPDVIAQAANDAMRDFAKSRGNAANLAVGGGEFGTASGFSDVMKSIRQSQGSNDPQLDVLKQVKTGIDTLVAALRSGVKLNPPVAVEGL